MKQLIAIILAATFLVLPVSRAQWAAVLAGKPPAAAATYLIEQNFEGTGYDNSETWTEANTPNPDYAGGDVIAGSQSLQMSTAFAETYAAFTGQTDVWVFAKVKAIGAAYYMSSATFTNLLSIRDTSGTVLAGAMFNDSTGGTSGYPAAVRLASNGGESASSSVTLAQNTVYNVWLHYVSGGTCTLHISSSTTKPTADGSGNVYLTGTGASGTAARVYINNRDGNLIWDHVLVSTSEIGDNP